MGRIGYCREHILDAGVSVLLQKGYNGTGVKDIVVAAEVPKGSFYNHFASKEAFVVEAIEKVSKVGYDVSKQLLTDQTISPKQRLLNFFNQGCEQMSDDDFKGGCLIGNLSLEMSGENTAIREATAKVMCSQVKLISKCLEEAKDNHQLVNNELPEVLAEFLFCAWEGAMMRAKCLQSLHSFDAFNHQIEQIFIQK